MPATSKAIDVLFVNPGSKQAVCQELGSGFSAIEQKATSRLDQLVGNARLVVLASHNHALVRDQCNIIITLEHGRIMSTERTDSPS